MVEELGRARRGSRSDNGAGVRADEEILKISHFPKNGGVKELVITKADDGGYFLRLGSYSKQGGNDRQVIRLDDKEMSYIAIRLLKVVLGV